jgi:diguanylate cyclase (GGDEF)-like protein/PAS domain S-box-containing protein
MGLKNRITNFLQSGFRFSEDEYELKLYHILYNTVMSCVLFVLMILCNVRFFDGNKTLAMLEMVVIFISLISMLYVRKEKHNIKKVASPILFLFFILVSFSYYTINIPMAINYYIILLVPAFYLGGIKRGIVVSIASFLTIVILNTLTHRDFTLFSFFYFVTPLLLAGLFSFLYEFRNDEAKKLLKEKNLALKKDVELKTQQTKELAEMVDRSTIELYIVDYATDHYLYVNKGSLEALGYRYDEMLKMSVYDVNPSLTVEVVQKMKEISKNKDNLMNITEHRRKDGTIYSVQSFMHMIKYHGKDAYVIYDINLSDQQKAHEEILRQKEVLINQAYYDTLTQLPNRALFYDRLSQAIAKSKRHKKDVALFFIDLDHFKDINDSFGHDVGDKVLMEVSSRFKEILREEDTTCRLGGDEFTIIMENFESIESISTLAQKIIENIPKPITIDGHKLFVTCSIGISIYPKDATQDNSLLSCADDAMYKAKKEGKNRFKFFAA